MTFNFLCSRILPASILLSAMIFFSCAGLFQSEPVLVKDYELKGKQRSEWNGIYDNWFRNDYHQILLKFNLHMNCSDCEYVYIRARLHVAGSGKISNIDIIEEHICRGGASEKLREAFMKYFRDITLPKGLRNMIIETMLGTGLKC